MLHTENIQQINIQDEARVTDKDQWRDAKDNSQYPYKCIGKVIAFFKNQSKKLQRITKQGIATLISQKFVVTASHIIMHQQVMAYKIDFYPSFKFDQIESKSSFAQGQCIPLTPYCFKEYNNKKFQACQKKPFTFEYDTVFLELKNPIYNCQSIQIDWHYKFQQNKNKELLLLTFKNNLNQQLHKHIPINSTNFSTPVGKKRQSIIIKYQLKQPKTQIRDDLLYEHTTEKGDSGAPALIKIQETQKYRLIGIHKGTSGNSNYCQLFSSFFKSQENFEVLNKKIIDQNLFKSSNKQLFQLYKIVNDKYKSVKQKEQEARQTITKKENTIKDNQKTQIQLKKQVERLTELIKKHQSDHQILKNYLGQKIYHQVVNNETKNQEIRQKNRNLKEVNHQTVYYKWFSLFIILVLIFSAGFLLFERQKLLHDSNFQSELNKQLDITIIQLSEAITKTQNQLKQAIQSKVHLEQMLNKPSSTSTTVQDEIIWRQKLLNQKNIQISKMNNLIMQKEIKINILIKQRKYLQKKVLNCWYCP